jgi:hypothetical protein
MYLFGQIIKLVIIKKLMLLIMKLINVLTNIIKYYYYKNEKLDSWRLSK